MACGSRQVTPKIGPRANNATEEDSKPVGSHCTLRPTNTGHSGPGAATSSGRVPCRRSQVVVGRR